MTIDELIAELNLIRDAMGGDAIVCEDAGGVTPGSSIQGMQGQIEVPPGTGEARKVVVLLGSIKPLK